MQVDHEISARLAAALPDGGQHILSNADLRAQYGLRRISAGARWRIAADLEQAGLQVMSDPGREPLVVVRPVTSAAPAGSVGAEREQRRRRRITVGGVLGAVVSAATVLGAWNTADVQRAACQKVLSHAPVARGIIMAPCAARYQPVEHADAQTAIDRFFAGASGAEPLAGWRMLSDRERASRPKSDWEKDWEPSMWADTSRVRPAGDYNVYTVVVRDYRTGGGTARRWRMRVRHVTDGGFVIDRLDDSERLNVRVPPVQRVTYAAAADVVRSPRAGAPVAVPARSKELQVGGQLSAMCVLRTHSGRGGARWWTRTNLGWIRNTALESRQDGPIDGLGRCDGHWAGEAHKQI
jgi:hypothetical protein